MYIAEWQECLKFTLLLHCNAKLSLCDYSCFCSCFCNDDFFPALYSTGMFCEYITFVSETFIHIPFSLLFRNREGLVGPTVCCGKKSSSWSNLVYWLPFLARALTWALSGLHTDEGSVYVPLFHHSALLLSCIACIPNVTVWAQWFLPNLRSVKPIWLYFTNI